MNLNYEAWLVPYAEGTLDAARAALLEARLARDPALAAQAETVRVVTARLRQAAAQNTAEADPRLSLFPAPLWPGVQARLAPMPRRPVRRLQWAGGACAAGLTLGALLLHGSLSGMGTRQTPPAVPARTASADSGLSPAPGDAARLPRKKKGRRVYARPLRLVLGKPKALPPMRLAARSPLAPPRLPAPSLPTPAPVSAVPSARTAVAVGAAHFRLASPVHEDKPDTLPRPASDASAGRANEDQPASDTPISPAGTMQAQDSSASTQDAPALAPVTPPLPASRHARTLHRHRARQRHHGHRHAAPAAVPASAVSPATPDAPLPNSHNSRAI